MKSSRRNSFIIGLLIFLFVGLFLLPGAGHYFADQECKNKCGDQYINSPEGIIKWMNVGRCELNCTLF